MTRPHDGTPLTEAAVLVAVADWYDAVAGEQAIDAAFARSCRSKAVRLRRAAWELGEEAGRG